MQILNLLRFRVAKTAKQNEFDRTMTAITSEAFVDFFEQSYQLPSTSYLSYSTRSSMSSLPAVDPVIPDDSADIQVEISGVSFLVSSYAFRQMTRLPWERIHATAYRLEGASPDTFEKTLDFILFRTLPKKKRMTREEQEDLVATAKLLGLSELLSHMQSKKGAGYQKKNRLGSFFGCRNSKASDVESCYGYRQNRPNTFTTN